MKQVIKFSMPFGMPNGNINNVAAFYEGLKNEVIIEVKDDNSINISLSDIGTYTPIYTMFKCMLYCVPVGENDLSGETLTTPTIIAKTWLWDFIELSNANKENSLLPQIVQYKNLDEASISEALSKEFDTNPRYGNLTEDEKEQLTVDFLDGKVKILTLAQTFIGKGKIENENSTNQTAISKSNIALVNDTNIIPPEEIFPSIKILAGGQVNGHPLLDMLSHPATPHLVPIGEKVRVKVKGKGLINATITVNGQPADEDLDILDNETMYLTIDADENTNNIEIQIVNTEEKQVVTLRKVNELKDVMIATINSHYVFLEELLIFVENNHISMDGQEKVNVLYKIDIYSRKMLEVLYLFDGVNGDTLQNPEYDLITNSFRKTINSLINSISNLLNIN